MNATCAVRLGSIAAGIAWIGLLFAPGSRAEDATRPDVADPPIEAASAAPPTSAPTTVPATTATTAAPTTSRTAAPGSTAPRVFSLRDLVGVSIDRATTWIAIATVTVVDQTGAPAAGVEVKASWSFATTAMSCRTDDVGKCSIYQSGLPADLDAVTITVTAPQTGSKSVRREGVN